MSDSGLIQAFLLDGKGGAQLLNEEEVNLWRPDNGVLWLHFNYTATKTVQWINNDLTLDDQAKEFLLSEGKIPQSLVLGEILLLSLRAINLDSESKPEDMVGLRILADQHRVITMIRRPVMSLDTISNSLKNGDGPRNTSEFIGDITSKLRRKMHLTIDKIKEQFVDLEKKSLKDCSSETVQHLAEIKHTSIALRKFMVPQRKAIALLNRHFFTWMDEEDRQHLRNSTDHLKEYIEDLVSISDRAFIVHEKLARNLSDQMKKKLRLITTTILLLLCGFYIASKYF